MELNFEQKRIVETDKGKVLVSCVAASGKAQPNDTIIPTPTGFRAIGSLRPGDFVFDENGKEQMVKQIFPQGLREVYEVTLSDGRKTECCGDHLWSYCGNEGELKTTTTKKLKRILKKNPIKIPNLCNGVKFDNKLYAEDKNENWNKLGERLGDILSITTPTAEAKKELEEIKHYIYDHRLLFSSCANRCDFFMGMRKSGIITLWGNVLKIVMNTQDKRIIDTLVFLLRSLGQTVTTKIGKKASVIEFNVQTTIEIKSIKRTRNKKPMSCILVAGEKHLYLTNDFIVTHNTRVLTERVKFLIDSGVAPHQVVVITFTNAAAEEMRKRLGEKCDKVFVGTIHSYANYLLIKNGINTHQLLTHENFDELFYQIQVNPQCIEPVQHLLLDEAQDTNFIQYKFLFDTVQPQNFFLVGDPRQTIYEWAGVNPNILFDIAARPDVCTYHLIDNYRNSMRVLSFAKRIICRLGDKYYDDSTCMSNIVGKVTKLQYDLNQIPTIIKESNFGSYNKWFVICRTNQEVDEVQNCLTRNNIPNDTFKKVDMTSEQLKERLESDTVKVLTIHTSKGLEADNVVVVNPLFFNQEEVRLSYVAATRAKKNLFWMERPKKRKVKRKIVSWE